MKIADIKLTLAEIFKNNKRNMQLSLRRVVYKVSNQNSTL